VCPLYAAWYWRWNSGTLFFALIKLVVEDVSQGFSIDTTRKMARRALSEAAQALNNLRHCELCDTIDKVVVSDCRFRRG
jgi:hypothetical protein